ECGLAGARIDDVVEESAAARPASLCGSRGGDGAIDEIHDGDVAVGIRRVGDTDTPGSATGGAPGRVDVAAGVGEKVARPREDGRGLVDSVAFADTAEVEAKAIWFGHGARPNVNLNLSDRMALGRECDRIRCIADDALEAAVITGALELGKQGGFEDTGRD